MRNFIRYLILAAVVLLSTASVSAQDNSSLPNTGAQRWFCLKPVHKGHNADLSAYPAGTPGKGSPIPGFPVYVFVRIDNKLTTGNPAVDLDPNVLGSRTNYDYLGKYGFGLLGKVGLTTKNPTDPANESGLVPQTVDWHDDLKPEASMDHFWFGMQIVPPKGNGIETGNDLAQKLGTFEFSRAAAGSDCEWIKWDPFGYVFDAQTLGPIQGAQVTIYDVKTGKIVPAGTGLGTVATNPFYTTENGSYTFFTDVGNYKLTLGGTYNGKPLTIEDVSKVNPGYSNADYKNLYVKDSVIEEKMANGVVAIVRTDIPVVSVGVLPLSSQLPQLTDVNIDRVGEQISINGKVTILPAEVTVIYKEIATQETKVIPVPLTKDETTGKPTRRFEFKGDQTIQTQEKTFVFSEIAVKPGTIPLTKKSLLEVFTAFVQRIGDRLFSVRAQNVSSIKIDPIPSYLEGITKDSGGKILSSVLVGIYLQGSNVPTYQTKSDINGHYVIGSQFVPPLPYEIRIKKATGEIIKMSTTEYLRQNADYHKTNSINSFSMVITKTSIDDTNTLVVTKTLVPQNNSKTNPNNLPTQPQQVTETGGIGVGTQGAIMAIVALMMLIMIVIGAFVVIKSKRQQMPPSQM